MSRKEPQSPYHPSSQWTPERVTLLTKLWIEGYSASDIANRIGNLTRNAVLGKVHRIGLAISSPRDPKKNHQRGKPPPSHCKPKISRKARIVLAKKTPAQL